MEQIMERPIPVLPLVGSTTVIPGFREPSRSAASIIARQIRSFTLPPGLKNSALPYTAAEPGASSFASRSSGVLPICSITLSLSNTGISVSFSQIKYMNR
jgi:hypothetical protein